MKRRRVVYKKDKNQNHSETCMQLIQKRNHLPLVFCLLLILTLSSTDLAQGKSVSLGAKSRFGIDYVFPLDDRYQNMPIAQQLSKTGAGWVNFAIVGWNKTEPHAPIWGKHRYKWKKLDLAVRHWQGAGFQIVMTLRMGKGWFSGPHKFAPKGLPFVMGQMMKNADRLPKPKHMDDFSAWVKAIVERYDLDGVDDMPGLKWPVLHYQVGNEVGNPAFWTGTPDDYLQLLGLARQAARQANANVKIIPSGLRPNDFFTENPLGEDPRLYLDQFLKRLAPAYRQGILRSLEFDLRIVKAAGQYDIIDAGGNGSWHHGSQGFFRWLRKMLDASGNRAEIWDMESRTEPILKAIPTTHAYLEAEIPGGKDILKALRNKWNPRHQEASRWYRAEQARLLTKVYATRFAGGAQKVFVGMPMDWDKGLEAFAWPNPYMGLLSSKSEPWPAAHALAFLIRELDGFHKAERVNARGDIRLFRFSFEQRRKAVWLVWLHEPLPRGLDHPLPREKLSLPQITSVSEAYEIPTSGISPVRMRLSKRTGPVIMTVSPTPVLIRE